MRRWQKGFTLIELLVVLAITSVIIVPLTMATITLLITPQRTADQGIVLQQVQNTGRWLSRDVQMTRTVSPGGANGFPLTLTIPMDDNPDNDYTIEYVFDGSKLKRRVYDSGDNLTSETFIADYIDTDNTTFGSLAGGNYKLNIRAVKGEAAVTSGYEVNQRLVAG